MTREELGKKLFDLVSAPPCRKCKFWDIQGHYCFSGSMLEDSCVLVDQILALGLVELAEDQTLPRTEIDELDCSEVVCGNFRWGVRVAQQDMIAAGWKKVKP